MFSSEEVKSKAKKVFYRQVAIGIIVCLAGAFWQRAYGTSLVVGALAGYLDGFLFLRSVVRGMDKEPQGAFRGMRVSMFARMGALLVMALFLKATGGDFLPAILCYLCLHLTLMFNMILFSPKKQVLK